MSEESSSRPKLTINQRVSGEKPKENTWDEPNQDQSRGNEEHPRSSKPTEHHKEGGLAHERKVHKK